MKYFGYVICVLLSSVLTFLFIRHVNENNIPTGGKDEKVIHIAPGNNFSFEVAAKNGVDIKADLTKGSQIWFSESKNLSAEEIFVKKLITENANSSSADNLAPLWDAHSFESIRKNIEDSPSMLNASRDYYKSIVDTRLVGMWTYGEYKIIFVQHKLSSGELKQRVYPCISRGGLLLTNQLFDDEFYRYFNVALREKIIEHWIKK